MTASKTVVLHCDGNDCTRQFRGLSERIWVARREARDCGWSYVGVAGCVDLCPRHAGEKS